MNGLLYKDFINLKPTFKIYCLIALIWAVIFIPDGNYSIFGLLMVMMSTLVITTLSLDDLAKWDGYALTMPVNRKEVVYAKYLLLLCLVVIGGVTALLIGVVGALMGFFDLLEMLFVMVNVFMIALIFGSTMLPLIYRFGTEKARTMILLVAGIFSGLILVATILIPPETIKALAGYLQHPFMVMSGCSILTVIYVFTSLKISVSLYESRDF
ncbi:ABC-2 transporter permease [Eubacteriaceae bacterium ES3]|nr:ABC-2 transporter permease [Eubacteriaceae bacterium ES3]